MVAGGGQLCDPSPGDGWLPPMLPPPWALILRKVFQVWKNRGEVQPGVERGPRWTFQAWLALIQWVATLHTAGDWNQMGINAPSSPSCSSDAIQWLEEWDFLAPLLVSGKEVHGSCAVYMKLHRYFFLKSKQINYFSHNSSFTKFFLAPNCCCFSVLVLYRTHQTGFPLPFPIPLIPTPAQLLSILLLWCILSSQNSDRFYLRAVFTVLVLSQNLIFFINHNN